MIYLLIVVLRHEKFPHRFPFSARQFFRFLHLASHKKLPRNSSRSWEMDRAPVTQRGLREMKLFQGGSCESLSSKGGALTGSDSGVLELSDSGGGGPPGEWDAVPGVVRQCIRHLENTGLRTLGVFRVSPSKKRVRQVNTPRRQIFLFSFTSTHYSSKLFDDEATHSNHL